MSTKFFYALFLVLVGCQNSVKQPITDPIESNALKVAQKIAFEKYGEVINNELPLTIKSLNDSIWLVEGTLPKYTQGGTVYLEVRKSDNKILRMNHYK